MEKQSSTSQDFCNTSQETRNVKVMEERRGDETWCITNTQFKDLEELRSLYAEWEGIKINRLEVSDGKFYYDMDLDTLSEDSSFSALTDITWTVILPGTPISHSANQVDGNTLTWMPTPKSGIVNLQAESEVTRGFKFPSCSSAFTLLFVGLMYLHRYRKSLSPQ